MHTLYQFYNKSRIFFSNNKRKGVLFFILCFFGDSIFSRSYLITKISICFFYHRILYSLWHILYACTTKVSVQTQKYTMDEQPTYKKCLVNCMNLAFGTNHIWTYMFSNDELFQLTPEYAYAYMCTYAFGTATPCADDSPTFARSNTIEVAKKAISFYMPNRLVP